MTKRNISLAVLALIISGLAVAFVYNNSINQERLLLALSWSGLEPLPATVSELEVKKEGATLNRTFRITFLVPTSDLEAWLNESEKLKNATAEQLSETKEKYTLEPERGARVAELVVDRASGRVELFVSLS